MRARLAAIALIASVLALFAAHQPRAQMIGEGVWKSAASTPAGTTWDPANIAANVALSSGNLTATYSGSSAVASGKTNSSHSTGKFYLEYTWTNFSAGGAVVFGLGNASAGTNGYQIGISDSNSIGLAPTGSVYAAGGTLTSVNGINNGNTGAIAIDIGGSLIWFKNITTSSNWNNNGTANPATGAGGISYSVAGALFVMFTEFSSGDVVSGKFSPTYAGTPPVGFGNF